MKMVNTLNVSVITCQNSWQRPALIEKYGLQAKGSGTNTPGKRFQLGVP